VPAPDPDLRPGPLELPEDPSGVSEPHDILAADEFAIPAAGTPGVSRRRLGASQETGRRFAVAALAGGLWALARRRRRGH
jgi:hypothetical protein